MYGSDHINCKQSPSLDPLSTTLFRTESLRNYCLLPVHNQNRAEPAHHAVWPTSHPVLSCKRFGNAEYSIPFSSAGPLYAHGRVSLIAKHGGSNISSCYAITPVVLSLHMLLSVLAWTMVLAVSRLCPGWFVSCCRPSPML
ncbi:uncharacterized protein BO72DRAFT_452933 [Aspergillus fijiensis CBS 313.89]|uniref:Uncharacterized protein n=1 Tax=Aspergillus fijiensis CBS 313.89 TaxID=1448319 RepID=A0A8G1VTM0_9EURO|nr:uncharacterized protein BO72DRAFT_452933 [Aspergillus fijiensis CBS 313.89]RAK72227.1 hypothetical protein BO72DRAFT_452933 [Aspergillus fijiensis CBS 313.89]